MRPLARAGGHIVQDGSTRLFQGGTAVVDDIVGGGKDAVRQPIATHEPPEVFDRVEFGQCRVRRQGQAGRELGIREVTTGCLG
jgi:hypothetical protein